MEKRGRGRGVLKRRRLLTAIAVAALSGTIPLFAVDVSVFVSSFELEPGQALLVEFSVPDANPADVTLSDFTVPVSFAPASGRKELRYALSDPVTVISREWIPSESGVFTIGPFPLVVRGERVSVAPVRITVTEPRAGEVASLVWNVGSPDEGAVTGRPLTISLEAVFAGTAGNVSCPAPENAILEFVSNPVPAGTRLSATPPEPVVVAVWRWTPLETGWQELPTATLRIVDSRGDERVLSSAPAGRTVVRGASADSTARVPGSVARLFSQSTRDDGSSAGGQAIAQAGTDDDGVAETLARLRNAEYTSFFPSSARNERIALEDSLGLSPSLPVPPAAWKPVALIGSVAFFSLAFVLRLIARPLRNKRSLFRPVTFSLFFASLLLAVLSITLYTRDLGASGVCRGGELYHVPETGSSVIARLSEGIAARIGRRVDEWAYVTTPDGMEGWVRSDAIIEYTTGH